MCSRLFLNGKGPAPGEQEARRRKKIKAVILIAGKAAAAVLFLGLFSAVSGAPPDPGEGASGSARRGDPGLLFQLREAPLQPPPPAVLPESSAGPEAGAAEGSPQSGAGSQAFFPGEALAGAGSFGKGGFFSS